MYSKHLLIVINLSARWWLEQPVSILVVELYRAGTAPLLDSIGLFLIKEVGTGTVQLTTNKTFLGPFQQALNYNHLMKVDFS